MPVYILTPPSTDCQPQPTYDLALGQHYERWLADLLTSKGFPTYQLQLRFLMPSRGWLMSRRVFRTSLWAKDAYENTVSPDLYDARFPYEPLLRPYQLDLMMKLDKVRRLPIEVKALTGVAFSYNPMHFSCCEKIDAKQNKHFIMMIINQDNEEVWVVPNDRSLWSKQPSKVKSGYSAGFDYAIDPELLIPLDSWLADR